MRNRSLLSCLTLMLLLFSCTTAPNRGAAPAIPEPGPVAATEQPPTVVQAAVPEATAQTASAAPEQPPTVKQAAIPEATAQTTRAAPEQPPTAGQAAVPAATAQTARAAPEQPPTVVQAVVPEATAQTTRVIPEQPPAVKQAAVPVATVPRAAPEREADRFIPPPLPPRISWPIRGKGRVTPEKMAAYLFGVNRYAQRAFVEELARIYVEEAAVEGINHDVAFAQMCLETGHLRFGGLVTPDMNNFCGLGAFGTGQHTARFPSPRIGVRAQIQHLKAYATDEPLKQELVDPRNRYVRYGSAPTLRGLAGTWATDPDYAQKIVRILESLYAAGNRYP